MPRQSTSGMKQCKWDDTFYLRAYELAKSGLRKHDIAAALGAAAQTWTHWWKTKPALRDAVRRARPKASNVPKSPGHENGRMIMPAENPPSFLEYVERHLPAPLRPLWERIVGAVDSQNNVERQIENILADQGKLVRMHLWVHALVMSNFNVGRACYLSGTPRATLGLWKDSDPDFAAVLQQIHHMKKDFFESSLCDLVARGDSPATIFANKTLNRDRGYGTETTVKFTGVMGHLHETVTDAELADVPIEQRRAMLDAVRQINERKKLPPKTINGVSENAG